jgi:hypothetical protein
MLRTTYCWLITDVSVRPIGSIYKGQGSKVEGKEEAQTALFSKTEPKGRTETSVTNSR